MSARTSPSLVLMAAITMAACDAPRPTEPPAVPQRARVQTDQKLIQQVRQLALQNGVTELPQLPPIRQPLVVLGKALAFDKILSGNRDIACMTCHVPRFGTSDGKSLSIGQGGTGVGPDRSHAQGVFIPRNAPPAYNLNAMRALFWDGRVEIDQGGHLHTPAGAQVTAEMQRVFEFGAISAQPMFPVTSPLEMRGSSGNELAAIPDDNVTAIWAGLMKRLGAIPQYRALFEAAYPGTKFESMSFAHASNAIAAFLVSEMTFTGSPWDRFLAGDNSALTAKQLIGAKTFLTLRCVQCHNGPTFSDQQFHNVAVAQIGPGQGNGPSGRDDFGRMNVTNDPADRYRFRTTPLRNVELTAPYGHDGAYATLREFIEHYSDSHLKLQAFDPSPLEPLLRGTLLFNSADILAQRDPILDGVVLPEEIVDQLMDYMTALTDEAARRALHLAPSHVPSGLPVDR